MQKKTVHITTAGFLIAIGLILTSALSLVVLAQTAVPESFIPLVQKDNRADQPQPTPTTTAPRPTPELANQPAIGGRPVPATVLEFYQSTGPEVMGRPVTDYNYNEMRQRYEMMFENVGIYVNADDPMQEVQLIPLGMEIVSPQTTPDLAGVPILPSIIRLFDLKTAEVSPELRGEMLDPLNQDEFGNPIRIFENMVMKILLSEPDLLLWENLPQAVGIEASPPVPKLDDNRFVFSSTAAQPDRGHNIPIEFLNYITANGGSPISGNPITEIFYPEDLDSVIRQCFEHMCLDYNLLQNKIEPAPLGVGYYKQITQERELEASPLVINLLVWEAATSIPQNQSQTIFAYLSQGDQPIINIQPVLEISAPNGQRLIYPMSPTDSSGISSVVIPPVEASNGAIVPYEICLLYRDATQFCVSSQYLIWNGP